MGAFFSVRLAPGVRISASSRGMRAHVGPRAARVHFGAGRTGVSTGAGPVTFYQSIGEPSGGRRGSGGGGMSVSQYERAQRDARRTQREQLFDDLVRSFSALLAVHALNYPAATRPYAPAPAPVDPAPFIRAREAEHLQGLRWWQWRRRRRARAAARPVAHADIAAEHARRVYARQETQRLLDEAWARLLANDPDTVMGVVDDAYEDNGAPAAPVDVDGSAMTVVMLAPTLDAVPDREPTITPTGRRSSKAITKTDRNELYRRLVCAHVIATVREGFAVAPSLTEITVVVVRRGAAAPSVAVAASGTGAPSSVPAGPEVLYAGTYERSAVAAVADWKNVDPETYALSARDALMTVGGRTKEMRAVDLSDEPQLAVLAAEVDRALAA